MDIGIFGGSFDPVHIGHLQIAEEVAEVLQLKQVWFIPVGYPPHRDKPIATPKQRWDMLKLAISDNARFKAKALEINNKTKAYTINTLKKIKANYPKNNYYLLMGADQIINLDKWHQAEKILKYAKIIGISRSNISLSKVRAKLNTQLFKQWEDRIKFLQLSLLDISSSRIRDYLAKSVSIRYLVPEKVNEYIIKKGLYLN